MILANGRKKLTMKFMSQRASLSQSALDSIGGFISTMALRLNKRLVDSTHGMKHMLQVNCPHCQNSQARRPDSIRLYGLNNHRWMEFQCIGCDRWVSRSVNREEGLGLISNNVMFKYLDITPEKLNETGEITTGYIEDLVHDMDDDPHLIAVLNKECP